MEKYYRRKDVMTEIKGLLRDTAKLVERMPKHYYEEEQTIEK